MQKYGPALNWLVMAAILAASGMLYQRMFYEGGHSLAGPLLSLCVGLPLLAYERHVILRRLYAWIHALPTAAYVIAELITTFLIVHAGFTIGGISMSLIGFFKDIPWTDFLALPWRVLVYVAVVCFGIVFVLRVRELLGEDVFGALLVGRYRKPMREQRIFLFIDLAGSTAMAEELGDLRAQQFLGKLFASFAEPVRRHKGAIDDYVGDCAIITWPFPRGRHNARCIRCVFDIIDAVEKKADSWQKEFGRVPRLRAALHGGDVVTAEIGVDHHKITYFGDTVNTTARLEALCKTLERDVLISSELLEHMTVPEEIAAEELGLHAVRGRGQALGVVALRRLRKLKAPSALSAVIRPIRARVGEKAS